METKEGEVTTKREGIKEGEETTKGDEARLGKAGA